MPKSLGLLFNLIACKAQFPTKWNVAEIVPIYKDGEKQEASNYRPIRLRSALSKLLETLIFNKQISVVHPILNPAQHGFRPKRSTTTNLIEYYLHEIFSCLDSNPSYLTTFCIDFQKAFDKVSHDLLLDKLSALSIGGNCLSLLRSYLTNRKQTLRINSTTSKELDVSSGVSQGFILGPLFFLVFMNSLPSCVMSKAIVYADDYKIVGNNPVTLNIDVRNQYRACHLANLFNDCFKYDILLDREHKSKLLELHYQFFISRYKESEHCIWRLLCGCNNCKDLKKLIFT